MRGCRALDDKEILAISRELKPRDRCIFIMGIRTGLRISELLSLNIEDVVDESGSIRDIIKVRKQNTKGKVSGRVIPLHSEVKEELSKYLPLCLTGDGGLPLFQSRGIGFGVIGRLERSVFHRVLKNACTRASIRDSHLVATHAMRKTFAKKFYLACNKDLYLLQQALGHSNVGITIKYLQEDSGLVSGIILGLK